MVHGVTSSIQLLCFCCEFVDVINDDMPEILFASAFAPSQNIETLRRQYVPKEVSCIHNPPGSLWSWLAFPRFHDGSNSLTNL